MSDEDPCECIFNHEMAMRRLLSLLRNNQGHCTDNECFQDGVPGLDNSEGDNSGFMMLTMLWMLGAFLLYMMRPNSVRTGGQEHGNEKPGPHHDNDRDDEPPAVM
eukprot:TRINITY_DN9063_c1_g1_i2.p1 TRINITY_DN9063_c1_g1~~TRINITY_DN9063_c1_g1_i2.p1  ORF type:complete len:105 (-),score=10.55 TRINITY_DN9063_c1_g1_i2:615-929(-)